MATGVHVQAVQTSDKNNQLESLIGPLLSNNSYKFDEFQLILFDLISNASDDGIQQYFDAKSSDIYRFILTLFITSLHKNNPSRLTATESQQKHEKVLSAPIKGDNPLNSILVSPINTLPPPPKRRNSEKQKQKPSQPTNADQNENSLSHIEESKEQKTSDNDKIMERQISTRDKNFFDDILANSDEQSQTNESYDGADFLEKRTVTSREHTTAEKFECNAKEKAIVNEWRHLLHEVNIISPSPQPLVIDNSNDTLNDDDKDDDAVFVASGI